MIFLKKHSWLISICSKGKRSYICSQKTYLIWILCLTLFYDLEHHLRPLRFSFLFYKVMRMGMHWLMHPQESPPQSTQSQTQLLKPPLSYRKSTAECALLVTCYLKEKERDSSASIPGIWAVVITQNDSCHQENYHTRNFHEEKNPS